MKAEDGKQHGAFRTAPSSGRWLLTQCFKAGSTLKSVSEMCCASMIVPLLLPRSEKGWEGRAGQTQDVCRAHRPAPSRCTGNGPRAGGMAHIPCERAHRVSLVWRAWSWAAFPGLASLVSWPVETIPSPDLCLLPGRPWSGLYSLLPPQSG